MNSSQNLNTNRPLSNKLPIGDVNQTAFTMTRRKGELVVSCRNGGRYYFATPYEDGWQVICFHSDFTRIKTRFFYSDVEKLARQAPVFAALPVMIRMGCV